MLDRYMTGRLIDLWFAEDVGSGDLTAQSMIDADATATFRMNARLPLTVAGLEVGAAVFRHYDPTVEVKLTARDGDKAVKGTSLMVVSGPARSLLTSERTALNIVQHMSGIATETARFVAAIAGTGARLIDTRKTTPGLRMLEKHAVVCGGGANHRLGLDGGVMIKDNHRELAGLEGPGGITRSVEHARSAFPGLEVEVEVDSLDELTEAIATGAEYILLDNMTDEQMAEAVRKTSGHSRLEASGGITLSRIPSAAATGVDFISAGALTHSVKSSDISMDVVLPKK